jgi:hypothetical protein
VAAVLGTIRKLGLEELIGPAGPRQRDLVTAMVTAAVIDGSSKLATARGLRAASNCPHDHYLTGALVSRA